MQLNCATSNTVFFTNPDLPASQVNFQMNVRMPFSAKILHLCSDLMITFESLIAIVKSVGMIFAGSNILPHTPTFSRTGRDIQSYFSSAEILYSMLYFPAEV